MCGISAILCAGEKTFVSAELYESLNMLQHRGQDAAGIITSHRGRLYQSKGNGLVRDVFNNATLLNLMGRMGIAHVRYPTAGGACASEAQPFYVNAPYGIALAHNGNLTNTAELESFLDKEAHRHINTNSDSEVLLNVFANELQLIDKFRIDYDDIFVAMERLMRRVRGGYAAVAMVNGYGIVAFRDPNGIRPLVYGSRKTESGLDHIVASESVVLDVLGFSNAAPIEAGEAVVIRMDGSVFRRRCCAPEAVFSPCIFEYVYFARPDSVIDGVSVYKSRLAMGENLADKILRVFPENDIDVVVPVPDTSRVAALQASYRLNKLYREGFIKNRYVGRTFIMPGQQMRKQNVRRKLNPMPMEFAGKNVLLVDDSIVRGTTAKEIISMVRECGAKKVYMASCAPPVRFANVYGIDMPSKNELVAHGRNEEEVAAAIGADRVFYQDLPDLIKSVQQFNPQIPRFDTSVFDGYYVTGDISATYLDGLEAQRNDSAKTSKDPEMRKNGSGDIEMLGLYNITIAS